MSDKLDKLLRTHDDSKVTAEASKKFNTTKVKIRSICNALSKNTEKYNPNITVDNIKRYLENKRRIDRILYSEISAYIFGLDEEERSTFITNVENLLSYTLENENKVDDDCAKIIIKIYDHSQLALSQIDNVKDVLAKSIGEAKNNLDNQVKDMQKEYVAILGIFSSVVLAFVGGLTYSTSVLSNIQQVSIYRISLVALIIGFVFLNIIYALFYYVDRLVKKKSETSLKPLFVINGIIIAMMYFVFCKWQIGAVEKRNQNLNETFKNENHIVDFQEVVPSENPNIAKEFVNTK